MIGDLAAAFAARIEALRTRARNKAVNAVRYMDEKTLTNGYWTLMRIRNTVYGQDYWKPQEFSQVLLTKEQADLLYKLAQEIGPLLRAQQELRENDPA